MSIVYDGKTGIAFYDGEGPPPTNTKLIAVTPKYVDDRLGGVIPNPGNGAGLTQAEVNALIQAALIAAGLITPSTNSVLNVSSASVNEGEVINHTVTMALNTGGLFLYQLTFINANASDIVQPPTFSNGVVLLDNYVSVPNSVSSFNVAIATNEDFNIESNESYILTIGGKDGVGTIVNDDFDMQARVLSISNVSAVEGSPLVHAVNLSDSSGGDFTYFFNHISTNSSDINPVILFSGGVSLIDTNTLRVPSGISLFTITVNTYQDSIIESDESYTITLDGLTAVGTSINNDFLTPADVLSVSSSVVNEGNIGTYTILLNRQSIGQIFPFSFSGSASNITDYSTTLTLTNGVTATSSNLNVPAGVTGFNASIITVNDTDVESDEFIVLTVGSAGGTITLISDDVIVAAAISSISSSTINEGETATFSVALSKPSIGQSFNYSLAGTAQAGVDYPVPISFSNGVTISGSTINVPLGVTGFNAVTMTLDDILLETTETIILNISDKSGTVTITDNDVATPSVVSSISSPSVNLGELMVFNVILNTPTPTAQQFTLSVAGDATPTTDYTIPLTVKDFQNNTLTLSGNTFTVPAGSGSFTVSTLVKSDAVVSLSETLELTIGGITGIGTISNAPATILSISNPSVNEGEIMVFTITTNKPTLAGQKFTPTLTNSSDNTDNTPAIILDISDPVVNEGEILMFTITTNKPTIIGQKFTPTLTGGV